MRLTLDEYRRGVVKWRAAGNATVVIRSRADDADAVASAPLSDPAGSVPDVVPATGGLIDLRPGSGDAFVGPVRIAWDRLVGAEIETQVWDRDIGQLELVGIPAPGRFDRLVVATPYLRWAEGAVVRTNDVVVRLTDGVVLERYGPLEAEHGEHRSSFVVEMSTQHLTGSFIEIVAPEVLGEEREVAFAVLALLATVLGDSAVGDVVQLGALESTPHGTEFAVRFPQHATASAANRTLRIPRPVVPADLDAFDRLLVRLLGDGDLRADALLPLRWYERALRAGTDVDRFLAAFIGLETLVTRRSKRLGFVSPMADLLGDPRVPELLAPLRASYPDDQVDRLLARLQNRSPSLTDRFARIADELGLGEGAKARFRAASDGRHPLVHGGRAAIDDDLPVATVGLLATVLRAVLGGDATRA